jgi:hypothetical protein
MTDVEMNTCAWLGRQRLDLWEDRRLGHWVFICTGDLLKDPPYGFASRGNWAMARDGPQQVWQGMPVHDYYVEFSLPDMLQRAVQLHSPLRRINSFGANAQFALVLSEDFVHRSNVLIEGGTAGFYGKLAGGGELPVEDARTIYFHMPTGVSFPQPQGPMHVRAQVQMPGSLRDMPMQWTLLYFKSERMPIAF